MCCVTLLSLNTGRRRRALGRPRCTKRQRRACVRPPMPSPTSTTWCNGFLLGYTILLLCDFTVSRKKAVIFIIYFSMHNFSTWKEWLGIIFPGAHFSCSGTHFIAERLCCDCLKRFLKTIKKSIYRVENGRFSATSSKFIIIDIMNNIITSSSSVQNHFIERNDLSSLSNAI